MLRDAGWKASELQTRRKGDRLKVQMAVQLRRQTTMTWKWIAQRLEMGHWRRVSPTQSDGEAFNVPLFIPDPCYVGATNNQAEQSLRPSVILRKLTFGNRSPAGARHHSVLSSLLITAQRQGRDARTALLALLTQPLSVAKKAFYHDSS